MQPLDSIKQLVTQDLDSINHQIGQLFNSELPLLKDVNQYVFSHKGKQLRPLIVLLTSKLINYTGNKHTQLAIIIEALHIAMLLHDDVVDNSQMRRGLPSVNYKWSDATGVLVGDFVYSRAFEMIAQLDNNLIASILASATNYIAEGEILQLHNRKHLSTDLSQYIDIVKRKTGKLFEVSVSTSLALSEHPYDTQELQKYGMHLGIAFQMIDDVLDYTGDSAIIGKQVGDDLTQGNLTLPLIYALQDGTPEQQQRLQKAITHYQPGDLENVIDIINHTQAIEKAKSLANQHGQIARNSLNDLEETTYKNALVELVEIAINRAH